MKRRNKWTNRKLQRKHNRTWKKFKDQENYFGQDRFGKRNW